MFYRKRLTMSSKVIKWFKRQASIRRHSDKGDDKTSYPQNNSEEKKKSNFPRLSFRKRNKKKTASASELPGDSLAIVGISKQYSQSVPQEMEAEARVSTDTKVSVSNSVSVDSTSLTTSPSKTDGYRSVSEQSYHSSFDYSKEDTNESLSLEGKQTIVEINENCEEVSKASNQQTFHSVNSSISSTVKYLTDDVESMKNTEKNYHIAPIVKMEEICDIPNDKEHPEEARENICDGEQKLPVSEERESDFVESDDKNVCDNNLNETLASTDSNLIINDTIKSSDSHSEKEIISEVKEDINVFEEIDRLVRDANSMLEISMDDKVCDNENKDENKSETIEEEENKNETIENETIENETIEKEELTKLEKLETEENMDELNGELLNQVGTLNLNEIPEIPSETNSNGQIATTSVENQEQKILNNVYVENESVENSETIKEKVIVPDLIIEDNEKLEIVEPTHESEKYKDGTSNLCLKLNISNEHNTKIDSDKETVKIMVTQPSPTRHSPNSNLVKAGSKTSLSHYPKELNPFGDDDEDESDDINEKSSCSANNTNVSPVNENGCYCIKENQSYEGHTNIDYQQTRASPIRNGRYCDHKTSNVPEATREIPGNTTHPSLNPFWESDDEETPHSMNSSNPFGEDDDNDNDTSPPSRNLYGCPPRLPPKSFELQHRKSSRGSLAPIPHPRKSKQSHHGSYTSLQNVSTFPVPAPRSITPFGSTRTLNESTNPFGDDDDDDEDEGFERKGLGRCSMQVSSSASVQEPFARSDSAVRGSLPPSSRFRAGKKKRQAPLPPGHSPHKPPSTPSEYKMFTSLPRKRSSTSPASDFAGFSKRVPSARAPSPHGLPPPRPPPPKI